jgi:DNA polymerase (family 10)
VDSLEKMARAARDRGYEWIALGDHSRSLRVAKGLSVEELRLTFAELEDARRAVKDIELMRSMEVDILDDGSLDYPDDVLDEIDVVVAAVHSRFGLPAPEMTERLVRAATNPRTDILGHLSGRLINKRPPYAFDAEAVLRAAAGAGTAIELNGQPDRQDADDVRARRAHELGAPLALGSDAHSADQLAFIEDAVTIARRAWLEPGDVLNCLTYRELRERLAKRARAPARPLPGRARRSRAGSRRAPRRGASPRRASPAQRARSAGRR